MYVIETGLSAARFFYACVSGATESITDCFRNPFRKTPGDQGLAETIGRRFVLVWSVDKTIYPQHQGICTCTISVCMRYTTDRGFIMKKFVVMLSAAMLCVSAMAFARGNDQSGSSRSRLLPLLVHVDAKGKVTDVDPAYKLRPSLVHTLRETVQKMITKPAMLNGKAVASQFVINFAVISGSDSIHTKLDYISTKALPQGEWYWVHRENNTLALSNQQGSFMPAMLDSRKADPNDYQANWYARNPQH